MSLQKKKKKNLCLQCYKSYSSCEAVVFHFDGSLMSCFHLGSLLTFICILYLSLVTGICVWALQLKYFEPTPFISVKSNELSKPKSNKHFVSFMRTEWLLTRYIFLLSCFAILNRVSASSHLLCTHPHRNICTKLFASLSTHTHPSHHLHLHWPNSG